MYIIQFFDLDVTTLIYIMEIKLNPNNTMRTYKVSELLRKINIPDCQRSLDYDHIESIYVSLKDTLSSHSEPKILSSVALAVEPDETIYIIDGNHRIHAYKKLLDTDGYDLQIYVQIINTQNHTETEQLFEQFNNSLPMSKLPSGIKRSNINKIVKPLYSKYCQTKKIKPIFSDTNSNSSNRPRISRAKFEEHIAKISQSGINQEIITNKIIEYNNELTHKNWSFFKLSSGDTQNKITRMLSRADQHGCRLGMVFLEKNGFQELYKLFNITPQKLIVRTKQSISRALRNAIWNKYCGRDSRHSECPFCKEKISIENFHCAHDLAEANGGELVIDNLYPCCSSCNLSMGKKSFKEWQRITK